MTDERLVERVRQSLKRRRGFREQRMFGGVGFLLNGNMCVGVWKQWLIVRLDKSLHDATMCEPFTRPFDITGRVMKGWAMIEPEGLVDDDALRKWVSLAIGFVSTLPTK